MNKQTAEEIRSKGFNRNTLTIDIDGFGRTIIFKSGGNTESPVKVRASAGGGVHSEGLFEPWEVEGEVVVSKELGQWMLKAYEEKNFSIMSSAVLETYSSTDNMWLRHKFLNARITKIFDFSPSELGGEVSMKIAFSLNDLEATEIF